MGVLAEYVRKEVDQIRAEVAQRKELLEEWLTSIEKLYAVLDTWIRAADGGLGILGTSRNATKEFISEPRLGNYEVYLMWVSFGGVIGNRDALIVPKSRYGTAIIQPPGREPRRADGTVEIKSLRGMPEYYLFRLKDSDGDRWYIRSYALWHSDALNNGVEELDPERFEAAILRVLQ